MSDTRHDERPKTLFTLATVLTLPIAAVALMFFLPPSATTQYIMWGIFFAGMITIPYVIATVIVICLSFSRTRGFLTRRIFLVGYLLLTASIFFHFASARYGPGP